MEKIIEFDIVYVKNEFAKIEKVSVFLFILEREKIIYK